AFTHHQSEIFAGASPGCIARLVDDVAQIIEPPGIWRFSGGEPRLARLSAFPRARGEAKNLHLHAKYFERARENIGAGSRHRDWPPTHRTGIIKQKGDDGVAEAGFLLVLE